MALYERYYGEFTDNSNILYHAEIWQESNSAFAIEEFEFQKQAISIEWKEQDKLEPIRSSSATIKILCWSDRKYIDLYTTVIKSVRLDIYRSGVLYWSGTMDTEQYEEPYYTTRGYVVSLTFSDFGVLERIKFAKTGFISINSLITYCLEQSGINYLGSEKFVSTKLSSTDTGDVLEEVSVVSDNFYDEDGEADSLNDVLKYIFAPLSLMIQQKAGHIYIFDYNSLSGQTTSQVKWARTGSVLTVDKVYNNAKITFSPYANAELIDGTVDVDSVTEYPGISVPLDESNGTGNLNGFTIYANDSGKGLTKSLGKFFRIDPEYSGNEEAGIAYTIKHYVNSTFSLALGTSEPSGTTTGTLFKPEARTFLAAVNDSTYSKYLIKITMSLLLDARMNPFETESSDNEKGAQNSLKNNCNIVYIPCRITLFDGSGSSANAICHFVNSNVKSSTSIPVATGWVAGASTDWSDCWLAWYDSSDLSGGTGIGGWRTNKHTIGMYNGDLPSAYKRDNDGYMIVLPKLSGVYKSGWLQVEIGDGYQYAAYDSDGKSAWAYTRWLLYKDLKVSLVDKNSNEIKSKDDELKAWLDKNAKEEYSVETHVGTKDLMPPNAKGAFFNTSGNVIIDSFYREGIQAQIEKLLCGTLFSQFASRHNKLEGVLKLIPTFGVFSDKFTSGSFVLMKEVQDLQANTSEISMVTIDKDNYSGVEYNQT